MLENTVLRKQPILWALRFVQAAVAVILLGITGAGAAGWHEIECGTPAKLAYNISAAALTLPGLLYLVLTTGMFHLSLPWSQWVQLPLDALYLVLWIAAVGTSTWMTSDCGNLCKTCSKSGSNLDSGSGYTVFTADLSCSCYFPATDFKRAKRDLTPRDVVVAVSGPPLAARQAFDAIMLVLFLASTAGTVFFIFQGRKQSSSNNVARGPDAENPGVPVVQVQNPGVQPVQTENPGVQYNQMETKHELSSD